VPNPVDTPGLPTEWALAHLSDLHLTDPLVGSGAPLRV